MKASREKKQTSGRAIAGLACLFALVLVGAATAEPVVYVTLSGLGAPPYPPVLLPEGTSTTVQLNMAESAINPLTSDPSEVCTWDGNGDERCYWDVILEAEGDVTLTGFSPNGDVVAGVSAVRLRLNGGDYTAGELDPIHLGDLSFTSTGVGAVWLRGGTVITAWPERVLLPPRAILYLPEPDAHLALAAGIALLALLRAASRRSAASIGFRRRRRSSLALTRPGGLR